MVMPFLRPGTVARIKHLRQRGFATRRQFWADAYEVWSLDRPVGWDSGEEREGWLAVESGMGRLKAGGIAELGDLADADVIFNEAQYEFLLNRETVLSTNDLLVTGGRVFHVERVTRGDNEQMHAIAHLSERAGDDIPDEVGP